MAGSWLRRTRQVAHAKHGSAQTGMFPATAERGKRSLMVLPLQLGIVAGSYNPASRRSSGQPIANSRLSRPLIWATSRAAPRSSASAPLCDDAHSRARSAWSFIVPRRRIREPISRPKCARISDRAQVPSILASRGSPYTFSGRNRYTRDLGQAQHSVRSWLPKLESATVG
jgi:hypothetical protein